MPTFWFSYFLKILSLNDKPQRTEVRNRLKPSDSAYDFHRSLRLHAQRFLVKGESLEDLLASAEAITQEPERNSLKAGLERLAQWRAANPGELLSYPPRVFESPDRQFKIGFQPDFGLVVDGRATAIHIWNTKAPSLVDRMVYAALSLLPDEYAEVSSPPEDFAVLSLRDGRLYRLSEATDHSAIGTRLLAMLDRLIRDLRDGDTLPPPPREDRPPIT